MTLFAGGRLHGRDVDVHPVPQTAIEIVTNQPSVLPPTYVDVPTGDLYVLRPATLKLNDPATSAVVSSWSMPIYALASLTPAEFMPAVTSAVITCWFTTYGTRTDVVDVQGGNGKAAVAAQETVSHLAWCATCLSNGASLNRVLGFKQADGDARTFASTGDRAKWIVQHRESTGHEVMWRDEPREEAAYGSQRTGDIQEGE